MKYLNLKKYYLLGIVLAIAIWYIVALIYNDLTLLPYPHQILAKTINLFFKWSTYEIIFHTLRRTFFGFALAFLAALIIAVISYFHSAVEELLKPFIAIIRSIPNVTLIFLLFLLWGNTHGIIILMFFVTFPILYDAILGGLKSIDKQLIDVFKIDSNNRLKGLRLVFLPLSMPYIFIGIFSAFGLSLKVEIMAEILLGNTKMQGIGRQIYKSYSVDANYHNLYTWSVVTIIILIICEAVIRKMKKTYLKK